MANSHMAPRISLVRDSAKAIPLVQIDEINANAYNQLASEYNSDAHQTCRDFDKANEIICRNVISWLSEKKLWPLNKWNVLEIGPGPESILPFFENNLGVKFSKCSVLDNSLNMLEMVKKTQIDRIDQYILTSAVTNPDWGSKNYDLIVALTCDPYLTDEFIENVANSLSQRGLAILTWPSDQWSARVGRKVSHRAVLKTLYGESVESFSFCRSMIEMQEVVTRHKLTVASSHEIELRHLMRKSDINVKIERKHGMDIVLMNGIVIKK